MAATNHERVGKVLEVLNTGLQPFVERELQSAHGAKWVATVKQALTNGRLPYHGTESQPEWDSATLLKVIWECWNDIFGQTLGRAERSLVSELMEVRNRCAHQHTFSIEHAYRAFASTQRLLNRVSAGRESEDVQNP